MTASIHKGVAAKMRAMMSKSYLRFTAGGRGSFPVEVAWWLTCDTNGIPRHILRVAACFPLASRGTHALARTRSAPGAACWRPDAALRLPSHSPRAVDALGCALRLTGSAGPAPFGSLAAGSGLTPSCVARRGLRCPLLSERLLCNPRPFRGLRLCSGIRSGSSSAAGAGPRTGTSETRRTGGGARSPGGHRVRCARVGPELRLERRTRRGHDTGFKRDMVRDAERLHGTGRSARDRCRQAFRRHVHGRRRGRSYLCGGHRR